MVEKDKDKLIEALQAKIDMLESILYQMPGNIYWKTTDDCYLGCNINNAKTLNFSSPQELVGKYGIDFLPPDIAKEVHEADCKIMQGRQEISFEERGIDSRGRIATYLSRKTPLYDKDNEVVGILGISVDITKQKQTEEKLKFAREKAEAASRAKSQFLAMISHEIRIPMTSILGFASFLKQDLLTHEERQAYVEHIIQSGNYLLTLINKFLDYSKLEADKVNLIPASLNFKKLIEDVITMLTSMAQEKYLSLTLNYDAVAPEVIQADVSSLQRILVNLIGNALKFTQKGGVTIQVKCLEKTAECAKLEIAVEDTGIGIPADKIKDVFKEFYQVEDIYTRSKSMTGTGLGLAITKKLVKLLNGKIQVSSKVNHGSTFSFVIPFPLANTLKPSLLPTENINENNFSSHLRILLIEDDVLVRIVHQRMLTQLGCQVDVAENAKEALAMIRKDYSMIFADIGLPDMNGFDLIKEMRKYFRETHQKPIIALTGFGNENEKERCLRAGADEVLLKPASSDALKSVIKRHIKKYNFIHE